MFRTHPLLHELERRARALGFTWAKLAAEVGIDRTTLAHIRSGRGRLSLGALHRIAVWFPTDAAIQRCVWEYLLHDVETARERDDRERLRATSSEAFLASFTDETRQYLRGFVADFAEYAVRGRGLVLRADDPHVLAHALSFLESELSARSTRVLRYLASARLTASALPTLAATPLLLVERGEFASGEMARAIADRAEHGKVTIVTVLAAAEAVLPRADPSGGWAEYILTHTRTSPPAPPRLVRLPAGVRSPATNAGGAEHAPAPGETPQGDRSRNAQAGARRRRVLT